MNTCKKHGADLEPKILALIACPPGWQIAHRPYTDDQGKVWTDPIAVFAHVTEACESGCTCQEGRVRAMIAGEHGALEFAADEDHIQPPGFVAVFRPEQHGWGLRAATDADADESDTAPKSQTR